MPANGPIIPQTNSTLKRILAGFFDSFSGGEAHRTMMESEIKARIERAALQDEFRLRGLEQEGRQEFTRERDRTADEAAEKVARIQVRGERVKGRVKGREATAERQRGLGKDLISASGGEDDAAVDGIIQNLLKGKATEEEESIAIRILRAAGVEESKYARKGTELTRANIRDQMAHRGQDSGGDEGPPGLGPYAGLSKIDLGVLAAQGDTLAERVLEITERSPATVLNEVRPLVDALSRGEIGINKVPGQILSEVLAEVHKQGLKLPSDSERKAMIQLRNALPMLERVAEMSEKINVHDGPMAKAIGLRTGLEAKLNLDDQAATYLALISGFTPQMARAVGHSGVLTEIDVSSVKELFPKLGDSKSLRDRKVEQLMSVMQKIRDITEKSTYESFSGLEDGTGTQQEDLSGMSSEELIQRLMEEEGREGAF